MFYVSYVHILPMLPEYPIFHNQCNYFIIDKTIIDSVYLICFINVLLYFILNKLNK